MGYYCTVPQCTSLAGKTKNVKFHRFPRNEALAEQWNIILKRSKPITKYSKVCSLHFTHADYNVTTMGKNKGQWKTLSKDAIPSQNLPKVNPDGTVMVIRKSRTVKYREGKKEDSEKLEKSWQSALAGHSSHTLMPPDVSATQDMHENSILAYRLQTLGAIANNISPQQPVSHSTVKPKKQDAFMQTDPVQNEDDDTQPNNSYSEVSNKSYSSEVDQYNQSYPKDFPKDGYPKVSTPYKESPQYSRESTPYTKETTPYPRENTPYNREHIFKNSPYPKESFPKESFPKESFPKESFPKESFPKESFPKESFPNESYPKDSTYKDTYESKHYEPKDYTKSSDDYIPQTNEEYNKEAEKYALERKSHNGYDLKDYQKQLENGYQKLPVSDLTYSFDKYTRDTFYQNGYSDSAEVLRNQQHNLQMLQEQHRINENQNFFNENHIKQELDLNIDDDKFPYERSKQLECNPMYGERRLQHQRLLDHLQHQVKQEPDTANGCSPSSYPGYYELPRPGPELLIAKQNALAAHTQLWQNSMKRPFFYSENTHYSGPQLLHRYDDIPRILQ